MWWDWTEITLLDSVLFSVLSLIILYLVGFGILRLISALTKKTDGFNSFDFLKRTNFRIFFGFIFVFLFLYILSIFNLPFQASTLTVISIAIIGFIATRHDFKIKLPNKTVLRNYAYITVFVVFFVTLFFSSMLITGFYGSTIDDGADHTLMVRVILDNPNALLTRTTQPYANIPLNYPVATHAVSAFLVTLLDVPIQKIIIMVSVILPSLIAISFYSTLKCLFESKFLSILGLIIAAFFAIGLFLGPISWGGLPFLLSLYISITGMGLIFVFLTKNKMTPLNAFLIGLIFFIASPTYPVALLIISLWFLITLSSRLIPKLKTHKSKFDIFSLFSKTNISIALAFLIPLLLNVPYFSFILTRNITVIQSSQLDSVSNSSAEIVKARIGFNWLFDIPALSHFFSGFGQLFILAPFSIILLIILFILRAKRIALNVLPKKFAFYLLLVYFLFLLILGYLTLTLYLPINFLTAFLNPERVWQHIIIPATIMTAVVIFSAIYFSYLALKRLLFTNKANVVKLNKSKVVACTLLILLIFNIGVLSIPIIRDQQKQYNTIGSLIKTYETLNQDDVSLMRWIIKNIPSDVHILVSHGDSGQFLTSVTQRQTVSFYSRFKNYSDLMTLLTSNSSDLRAVPLMVEYNVSYVYIGSTAITYSLEYSYRRHFNATQFLSTPYFTLTKQIGAAWLFQFNASEALNAYKNYVDLQIHQS